MTGKTLFFEDIVVGTHIPQIIKKPTSVQLFMYSAVTWNTHRIHYDADFARDHDRFPGILVHGGLYGCFLVQLVTGWIRETGTLKRISWSDRGIAILGDTLTCQGIVTSKYVKQDEALVECDTWIENQRGEKISPGKATVILPMRSNTHGSREGKEIANS